MTHPPTHPPLSTGFYPELKEKEQLILEVVADEERSFGEMLDRGIKYFADEILKPMQAQQQTTIPATQVPNPPTHPRNPPIHPFTNIYLSHPTHLPTY